MGLAQMFESITSAPAAIFDAVTDRGPDRQDQYGNGFLSSIASQQAESSTAGFFSSAFDSVFGGDEKVQTAKTGVSDAVNEMLVPIDRELAREDLGDKLSVTGEKGKGKVSQEEMDEMVALYSDIRLGRSSIQLDTKGLDPESAAKFRLGAMDDIGKMMQTPSGRKLLKKLGQDKKKKTTLKRSSDPQHPVTTATLPQGTLPKGASEDEINGEIFRRTHTKGQGTDSVIQYGAGETVNTKHEGEIESDVTLFHEMVHAHHNAEGDNVHGGVENEDGAHVDNDEFQAVGLLPDGQEPFTENGYRAERDAMGDKTGARKTYGGALPF